MVYNKCQSQEMRIIVRPTWYSCHESNNGCSR